MAAKFDVAVIGAGPGGSAAALRAAELGLKVVCIDKRESLGGTCLNIGCIPSKTLLYATEVYDHFHHGAEALGIDCQNAEMNFPRMMERKKSVVKGLAEGLNGQLKGHGVAIMQGTASFLSAHLLEIENGSKKQQIEAEHIILATGSEPISLPFLPFDEKRVISSTGALSMVEVPKTMIVIGAGIIGVELASVYRRLGTQVTLVEMLNHICPGTDKAISQGLQKILQKQGLSFLLSTQVMAADMKSNQIVLSLQSDSGKSTLEAECVMVSVGRRPYSQGLGLEKIGIQTSPKGFIPIDGAFRTLVPHVYAVGDLVEGPMLAHRASEEGVAVAEVIAGKRPRLNYIAIPNVIYTTPEVASVGLTEQEAKEAGLTIKVGSVPFKANPRARCMGQIEGMVKIIGDDSSDRLLGLHILGPQASEMIGEGVLALEKKATLKQIAYAPHAHPTLSEAIKEAAQHAK